MSKRSASARGFRPRHLERMSDSDTITRLNAALEGRYRIDVELGEGGMATVYLADDLRHERKVALKVLKAELAAVVGAERSRHGELCLDTGPGCRESTP